MRLDLYLKACRLVKRRAVAQELCDADRVLVNGREAKSAKDIKPGDRILLKYTSRHIELEALIVPLSHKNVKQDPETFYRVVSDKRISQEFSDD